MRRFIVGNISLIAPSLLHYEVLNNLKYTFTFDEMELNMIGKSLENYGIIVSNIVDKTRNKMIEIALNHDLTMYDATYVALAIEENITLITADRKIKRKLPKNYKKLVFDIDEYKKIQK